MPDTPEDLDIPEILTISWDEDDALVVDPGENMTQAQVLGMLVQAAFQELVEQTLTSLGIKLPED
jgi:hypothetical protein